MSTLRRAVDWTFRDRTTGAITIAQWPNRPLWLFLGFSALRWVLDPPAPYGVLLQVAASGTLAWWAADELLRGVNPWRRALGGVVLAGVVVWGARALIRA